MDIAFGIWCDAHAWPAHGGGASGSLGRPVLGPGGLLDVLETVYGLGGPSVPTVERTAAWQRALEAVDDDRRFWSASLKADAWSTAHLLLGWRDALVDAAWDARAIYRAPRLRDLAAAERAAGDLPQGSADRLREVTDAVREEGSVPVPMRLRLVDARSDLPPGLGRLIDALDAAGATIEQLSPAPAAPSDTALGRLQRHLLQDEKGESDATEDGTPDGTVTHLRGSSPSLAAEVLADRLSRSDGSLSTVVLAPPQDGRALDEAFARRGAPRTGAGRPSPHRGALQVLRLAFQIAWRPLDVRALLDLLLSESGPIPRWVARRLADTLERTPGIGGPAWIRAWEKIEEGIEEDGASERIERWKAWIEPLGAGPLGGGPAAADPDEGLTLDDARAICDRVAAWATGRYAAGRDPLFLTAARDAGDVRAALDRLGRDRIPRALIDRIVDQTLEAGETDPVAVEEAAPWRRVAHPGAVWGPADTVVWWDFRDAGERPPRSPWTRAERAELAAHGAEPDEDARAARALAAAWERAVLHARERLLFVTAGLDAHGDDGAHPLAHRIAAVRDRLVTPLRAEDALHAPARVLAGAELTRVPVETRHPPRPVVTWSVPGGFFARLASRSQSATSLEHLLSCQLRWALSDVARLRAGGEAELPEGGRLLGNLAHEMAATLFEPGRPPDPTAIRSRATALLEELLPRSAAPLLLPENAVDLARARRYLPDALAKLAETLRTNRLDVVASEAWTEGRPPDAPPLVGFIDLLAEDEDGHPVIVDLKWTRSRNRRAEEVANGEAVQLATYGALTSDGAPARGGYFLLQQRQFVVPKSAGLTGSVVHDARDLDATWTAVLASWRAWQDAAREGTLMATGVDPKAPRPEGVTIARDAMCDWCDFAGICHVGGGA